LLTTSSWVLLAALSIPSPLGTLSSFMGEKVPEGQMRVWMTNQQKARIAAGFLFGARHLPGVQCINNDRQSTTSD
ncbi:hypothetical protein OC00_00980, partial [Xanthomonas vasicola]|uniref:hypothetical protein n=3 Tax=Xanthomonas vasicola TaxID=56459 RepID=UPI0005375FCF